MTRLV